MIIDKNTGWVYLIKSGRYLKIGITKENIKQRMSNYLTHNPHQIILKEIIFVKNYQVIESVLLNKYCGKKQNDWFAYSKNKEKEIREVMLKYQKKHFAIPNYKQQLLSIVYKQ